MPDKTTAHIQSAARAIHEVEGYTPWADLPDETTSFGTGKSVRAKEAIAALSTTLEPSEAEVEAACKAMSDWALARNIELVRRALIAAARVRLGSQGADL